MFVFIYFAFVSQKLKTSQIWILLEENLYRTILLVNPEQKKTNTYLIQSTPKVKLI